MRVETMKLKQSCGVFVSVENTRIPGDEYAPARPRRLACDWQHVFVCIQMRTYVEGHRGVREEPFKENAQSPAHLPLVWVAAAQRKFNAGAASTCESVHIAYRNWSQEIVAAASSDSRRHLACVWGEKNMDVMLEEEWLRQHGTNRLLHKTS